MYAGIWTGIFEKWPLHETLETLAAAGWRAVEISDEHLDRIMTSNDPQMEIEKANHAAKKHGLLIPQAHAHLKADITHEDPQQRADEIQWVFRHFEIARQLGARDVIVHPGVGCGMAGRAAARRTLELNANSFKMLCDKAGEQGLRVAVENLFDHRGVPGVRRFGAEPGELADLLEAVDAENFGIVFDTSHANIQRLDMAGTIREYGKSLICTHISDNDGSGDQHRVPGSGSVNWGALVGALHEVGYNGMFNLEVPGERHPDAKLQRLKLDYCRRVAESLCAE